jgi:hypothetical protein
MAESAHLYHRAAPDRTLAQPKRPLTSSDNPIVARTYAVSNRAVKTEADIVRAPAFTGPMADTLAPLAGRDNLG